MPAQNRGSIPPRQTLHQAVDLALETSSSLQGSRRVCMTRQCRTSLLMSSSVGKPSRRSVSRAAADSASMTVPCRDSISPHPPLCNLHAFALSKLSRSSALCLVWVPCNGILGALPDDRLEQARAADTGQRSSGDETADYEQSYGAKWMGQRRLALPGTVSLARSLA